MKHTSTNINLAPSIKIRKAQKIKLPRNNTRLSTFMQEPIPDSNGLNAVSFIGAAFGYLVYKHLLHSNIDYDYLIANNPYDDEFIDSLVEIMLDAILTEEPKQVNIGKETKPREVVKSVYMKLTSDHMDLVITKFKEQSHKIINKTAYLKTMLYNSYLEIDAYYTNQVKVDYAKRANEVDSS